MTHVPIKTLTREEVEKMAEDHGMGSFARQALLEADFMDCKTRFLLVGDDRLVVQRIEEPDPED
jgi:hypothetical protein